ncbi:hypothetical protein [Bacillus sp. FJAT-45037]|uniref:hypothetical protein n=1 Tax=Bacillus sp. FJAT-45037 TaxID=2011007 RepID=UPI000C24FD54|nr:hypothetical protein [Bacillus sp. FJAT-45037]
MYNEEPDIRKMMQLSEKTIGELTERYDYLMDELKFARNAFEFEKTSEIKMKIVYIIEELKVRDKSSVEE